MEIHRLLICVLTATVLLIGCGCKTNNTSNEVNADISSNNNISNERYPSFAVESITVKPGEKDITICVSLKDNPGFLTMAMDIEYDSNTMSLTKTVNGSDYSNYYFVGPKNLQSGCTASWFLPDIPQKTIDGTILELHFSIKENANKGSYPIKITRSQYGGIVDEYKNEIIFNNAEGYITIN